MDIHAVEAEAVPSLVAGLDRVYRAAFAAPPWNDDEPTLARFPARALRDAGREGFRLRVARGGGRIEGFAYGHVNRLDAQPELEPVVQRVAGRLSPAFFEGSWSFVELAVHPAAQRRGLGGRLHDALLDEVDEPRRWLLTSPRATAALALYEQRGWRRVHGGIPSSRPNLTLALLVQGLESSQAG